MMTKVILCGVLVLITSQLIQTSELTEHNTELMGRRTEKLIDVHTTSTTTVTITSYSSCYDGALPADACKERNERNIRPDRPILFEATEAPEVIQMSAQLESSVDDGEESYNRVKRVADAKKGGKFFGFYNMEIYTTTETITATPPTMVRVTLDCTVPGSQLPLKCP